jgi:hypothetical protein
LTSIVAKLLIMPMLPTYRGVVLTILNWYFSVSFEK